MKRTTHQNVIIPNSPCLSKRELLHRVEVLQRQLQDAKKAFQHGEKKWSASYSKMQHKKQKEVDMLMRRNQELQGARFELSRRVAEQQAHIQHLEKEIYSSVHNVNGSPISNWYEENEFYYQNTSTLSTSSMESVVESSQFTPDPWDQEAGYNQMRLENVRMYFSQGAYEILSRCFQEQQEELDLSKSELDNVAASVLSDLLKNNQHISRLVLRSNNIGDKGASAIADLLCDNPHIERVQLFMNEIGDHGAKELSRAVRHHNMLSHLDLSMNNIGPEGASALLHAKQCNLHGSMIRISLYQNSVKENEIVSKLLSLPHL